MTKRRPLVVVDGSNLATEGRTTPSLKQLEESVGAFLAENPDRELVVVVDATFEHRVAPAERERVRQAELAGEIVTPPAGAIGRGDAFILKIAARSDAAVLSNDSFQEFQEEHPWLFDEGRLIGGKPVSKVGWIFTTRNPVRAQRSSRATKASAKKSTKAAKAAAAATATSSVRGASKPAAVATKAASTATKAPKAVGATKATRSRSAAKATAAVPARAAKSPATATARTPAKRRARAPRAQEPPAKRPVPPGSTARGAGKAAASARAPKAAAASDRRPRTEPVNSQRSFLRLVSDHPLGSTVEGEVTQFTSHGAMVQVPVGQRAHVACYAPLAGLGRPAPQRARDVLKKGATYPFTVVAFDSTRRRAELALAQKRDAARASGRRRGAPAPL